MSLRSASADSFAVIDVSSGELLGSVEAARAFSTVHEGAVYLHLGRSYVVRELDLGGRRALVEPHDAHWYTQPKTETLTWIEQVLDARETCGLTLRFGRVSVTETVIAYQRKSLPDHAVVDLVTLDLPATTFETQALWYELDDDLLSDVSAIDLLGALHAAEHSQIAVLPLHRDVRPLGHRRALDEPAPADRRADDLHLRRAPGRRRDHPRRARAVRDARRRRAPARQRVPVRVGLPVVRAVAEVRQPQRAALQGRIGRVDAPHARRLTATLQGCSFPSGKLCIGRPVQGLRDGAPTHWS